MSLINKEVTHKVFGKGRITKCDDSFIEINFPSEPSGTKKFVFPDAFGPFLTPIGQGTADLVDKVKQEKRKKEREARDQRFKKMQLRLKREKGARKAKARRAHPRSQSVFWCKPEEIKDIFTNWRIFTGVIKSGQRKGQPRRLARLKQNSACLITVREAGEPEAARRIMGVFMVNQFFDPAECKDGYIRAHSRYRLRLPEGISKKMLFWNYYADSRNPDRISWGSGRQRYFDNVWMAKILEDIILLVEEPQEQRRVQDFLEYFCKVNNLTKEEIPEPSGALVRV